MTKLAEIRLCAIRHFMGFIQDGSSETIRIGQDDATKEYFVFAGEKGKNQITDSSFEGLLDKLVQFMIENPD